MRGRKEHVITAVEGNAQPRRLIALSVDVRCEGDPTSAAGQRETAVAYSAVGWSRTDQGVYYPWESIRRLPSEWWGQVQWAARRPGVTWLIAVRAVRLAALMGLWEGIDDGRVKWDGKCLPSDPTHDAGGCQNGSPSVVIDDPPTIIRFRVPGCEGHLWLMDARNWGLEAPPGLHCATDEARWLAGAMRRMVDCLAERGWGGLKATTGSQALYTWRRAFMTHAVVAHNDDDVLALEGQAYVGGRCEARRIGPIDGPLYWCDRRSAYGAASACLDVPLQRSTWEAPDLLSLRASPGLACRSLAEVQLETDEPAYPVRCEHGTVYPIGRLRATLCGPELVDALWLGRVHRVCRAVTYDTGPALRAYALALWDARCQAKEAGDKDMDDWLKRMLACLPGKMGQRVMDWQSAPEVIPEAPWCRWWGSDSRRAQEAMDDGSAQFDEDANGHTPRDLYALRSLGGSVQRGVPAGWAYDSAPAVACWILADARMELLRAIRAVGWEHALYYDTDSLLLDELGWIRLSGQAGLVGNGLGQWRLVRVVQRATIHGIKHYEHDGLLTCAGMPRQDVEATSISARYWHRETFGMALAARHAPRAGRKLRTYHRPAKYLAGRLGDGGRVLPHYREDW